MKKRLSILLCMALVLTASACGSPKSAENVPTPSAYAEPDPSAAPSLGSTASPVPEPTASSMPTTTNAPPEAVDVDLTQLSSTMVYSEVYAMMREPEQYLGKSIKMRGAFTVFQGTAGQLYFSCLVQDALACCAQGLEFELSDARSYPEEYPAPGSEITVVGTFDTYQEENGGNTYIYLVLRNASLM